MSLKIVWVSALGRIDFKGLAKCFTKKEASLTIRYLLEDFVRDLRTSGSTQFTLVMDIQDLSMIQLCNKRGTCNFCEFLYCGTLFSS